MPAREGDDGRSRLLQADGTLGLDVHLEGAVVLAPGWVGIITRGILAGTVGLETNSARGEIGRDQGENKQLAFLSPKIPNRDTDGYSERELQYSRAGDGVLGLLLAATAAGRRAHGPQEGEEGAGVHGCVEAKIMRGA